MALSSPLCAGLVGRVREASRPGHLTSLGPAGLRSGDDGDPCGRSSSHRTGRVRWRQVVIRFTSLSIEGG